MATPTSAKIEELRFRVKTDPKSRHFYPLAEELRKVGAHEEAEKVLREGLANNPSYLSAWISLGRVLKETSRQNDAIEVFQKAMTLDAENLVAARLSGECFLALGDNVEAIKKFKFVNALMPGDEEIENQIAALEAILAAPVSPSNETQPALTRAEPSVREESFEPGADSERAAESAAAESTPAATVDMQSGSGEDDFPRAEDGYAATPDAGYSPAGEDLFDTAERVDGEASFAMSNDGALVVEDQAAQSLSVFENAPSHEESADVFEAVENDDPIGEVPQHAAAVHAGLAAPVSISADASIDTEASLFSPGESDGHADAAPENARPVIDQAKAAAVARLLDWEERIKRQQGE